MSSDRPVPDHLTHLEYDERDHQHENYHCERRRVMLADAADACLLVGRVHLVGQDVAAVLLCTERLNQVEDLQGRDRDRAITTIRDGRMDGMVTLRNACHAFAPSIFAASIISVGTPLMAAESTTVAKPA